MARILYISQSYVPSRTANSVHVMHMCDALARAGHEIELITKRCPPRCERGIVDDFRYYGISPSFTIQKLMRPDFRGGGLLFSIAVSDRLRSTRSNTDLVYCRFLQGARTAAGLGIPTIYEAHGVPGDRRSRRWFRELLESPSLQRLVVITDGLLRDLEREYPIPPKIVLVEPDAVRTDFLQMVTSPSQANTRQKVGYVGHLYEGRGIPFIIELAQRLPTVDFEVVGGLETAIDHWRQKILSPNLVFSGFVEPRELPEKYSSFDILLMPHEQRVEAKSGRSNIVRWMSPMKMFEYMATGRPIIASDLPAIREILAHEGSALLAEPGNIDSWESSVRRLLADRNLAEELGASARRQVAENHTWDIRAARVLEQPR